MYDEVWDDDAYAIDEVPNDEWPEDDQGPSPRKSRRRSKDALALPHYANQAVTERICVRMSQPFVNKLDVTAGRVGKTRSAFVREAIELAMHAYS